MIRTMDIDANGNFKLQVASRKKFRGFKTLYSLVEISNSFSLFFVSFLRGNPQSILQKRLLGYKFSDETASYTPQKSNEKGFYTIQGLRNIKIEGRIPRWKVPEPCSGT